MWQYLAAAAIPYAVDALTGASSKVSEARNKKNKIVNDTLTQLNTEIGTSTADSAPFKTAKAQLDKSYQRASNTMMQNSAASGASAEAQIGGVAGLNSGMLDATQNAFVNADAKREALKQQYRALLLGNADDEYADALGAYQQQNQMMSSLGSMIPYLAGMEKKK